MKKYTLLTILFYLSFYITLGQGQDDNTTSSSSDVGSTGSSSSGSPSSSLTSVSSSTDVVPSGTDTTSPSTSLTVSNTSIPIPSQTEVSTAMSLTSSLSSIVLNSTPQSEPVPTLSSTAPANGNTPLGNGPIGGGVSSGGTSGIVVVTSTMGIAQPQPTDGIPTNGSDTTSGAATQRGSKSLIFWITSTFLIFAGLSI